MMQFFHGYTPADGSLWKQLAGQAASLSEAGITSVWLPPAYKGAAGADDTGYGVYDLFDLGEYNQKGSIRTKYGTRDEYLQAIQAAHVAGMQVYADGEMQPIKAWTHFTFPGRGTRYSSLKWHW